MDAGDFGELESPEARLDLSGALPVSDPLSDDGNDLRRHRRVAVDTEARITLPSGIADVRLGNVSIGGLLVVPPDPAALDGLQPGDEVAIDAPGLLEGTRCNVVGVSPKGLHLAFEANPDFSLRDLAQLKTRGGTLSKARRLRQLGAALVGVALLELRAEALHVLQSTLSWLPETRPTRPRRTSEVTELIDIDAGVSLHAVLAGLTNKGDQREGTLLRRGENGPQTLAYRMEVDGDGTYLVALHDKTDYVLQEENIERLTRNLAGESEDHSRYLASLAHDLRAPIGAIKGYAELLTTRIHGPLNDKQSDALETIAQACDRLTEMVGDVLDGESTAPRTSESPAVGTDYHAPVTAPIGAVVHGVVHLFRHQAQQKGLNLVVVAEAEDLAPLVDGIRMRRVITNLASNAIKFTRSGVITIKVGHGGGWISVAVEDTGPGIPDEIVERVFEASFKYGTESGNGLGLWIVRTLLHELGGSVALEKAPGGGTIVSCLVPEN